MQNPLDTPTSSPVNSRLSEEGSSAVALSLRWMRFAGVLFLIVAGIVLLSAIAVFVAVSNLEGSYKLMQDPYRLFVYLVFLLYFAVAAFSGILGFQLFRTANGFGGYLLDRSGSQLDDALGRMKWFWRFIGIFSILSVVLVLAVLLFVFTVLLVEDWFHFSS